MPYCCTLLLYSTQDGYPAVRKPSLLTSCMPWNADPFTRVREGSPKARLSWEFVQDASLPFTRVHCGR